MKKLGRVLMADGYMFAFYPVFLCVLMCSYVFLCGCFEVTHHVYIVT